MNKSIKEIIQELRDTGHEVKARKRPDGGWLITKLDGVSYKLAEGNRIARSIVGATLSEARSEQLKSIAPEKKFDRSLNKYVGLTPKERKRKAIDEDLKKTLRKAQKIWRKYKGKKQDGKPTLRKLRYTAEHYGAREAKRLLESAIYYAKGIAYPANVDWLLQEFIKAEVISQEYRQRWTKIIYKVEEMRGVSFTEDMLKKINGGSGSILYRMGEGTMTEEDALIAIENILGLLNNLN